MKSVTYRIVKVEQPGRPEFFYVDRKEFGFWVRMKWPVGDDRAWLPFASEEEAKMAAEREYGPAREQVIFTNC